MENLINFYNSRNAKLVAILDNPSGKKDIPIFVLCHGHGSHKDSSTFLSLVKKLAPEQISSFRFDFSGHKDSEGKFEDFTPSQAVDDINCAVDFLKNDGYSKIGLVGSSLGAFASVIVAAQKPEIIAVALKSPTLDLRIWKTKMIAKFGKNWEQEHYIVYKTGSVECNLDEQLLDVFVNDGLGYNIFEQAKNVKATTLIVHGENDETVPIETSEKISKIIPNCRLQIIKGADHEYTTGNTFNEMIDAFAEFILNCK